MFRIDHPVSPGDKILSHSFVESPDMKNIYDGIAQLDANGRGDGGSCRIGSTRSIAIFATSSPASAASRRSTSRRKIAATGSPSPADQAGIKVSWQVTGTRQDAWANANRIAVEEDKPAHARGYYLHPEVFGFARERGIDQARIQSSAKVLAQR